MGDEQDRGEDQGADGNPSGGGGKGRNPFEGFRIEIDPEQIDRAVEEIRKRLTSAVDTSRYTRVRLSYRGKPILPDIPLAVLLAGEGLTFWFTGPLTAVLVNLGATALLEVELIHDADELVRKGQAAYLDGELEEAEGLYRKALARRPGDPSALYNLGVLLRVTGRRDEARDTFREAAMGPEAHPDVARASEALSRMEQKRTL